jgi:hypothetical protein
VWVNIYPPALIGTDPYGVTTASLSDMYDAAPNRMFLSLASAEIQDCGTSHSLPALLPLSPSDDLEHRRHDLKSWTTRRCLNDRSFS